MLHEKNIERKTSVQIILIDCFFCSRAFERWKAEYFSQLYSWCLSFDWQFRNWLCKLNNLERFKGNRKLLIFGYDNKRSLKIKSQNNSLRISASCTPPSKSLSEKISLLVTLWSFARKLRHILQYIFDDAIKCSLLNGFRRALFWNDSNN